MSQAFDWELISSDGSDLDCAPPPPPPPPPKVPPLSAQETFPPMPGLPPLPPPISQQQPSPPISQLPVEPEVPYVTPHRQRKLSIAGLETEDGELHLAMEQPDGTLQFFRTNSTLNADSTGEFDEPRQNTYDEEEINQVLGDAIKQHITHPEATEISLTKEKAVKPAVVHDFDEFDSDSVDFVPPPPPPPQHAPPETPVVSDDEYNPQQHATLGANVDDSDIDDPAPELAQTFSHSTCSSMQLFQERLEEESRSPTSFTCELQDTTFTPLPIYNEDATHVPIDAHDVSAKFDTQPEDNFTSPPVPPPIPPPFSSGNNNGHDNNNIAPVQVSVPNINAVQDPLFLPDVPPVPTEFSDKSTAPNASTKRIRMPPTVKGPGGGYDTSVNKSTSFSHSQPNLQTLDESGPLPPIPPVPLSPCIARESEDTVPMTFETVDVMKEVERVATPSRPSRPSAFARLSSTPGRQTVTMVSPPPPIPAVPPSPKSQLSVTALPPTPQRQTVFTFSQPPPTPPVHSYGFQPPPAPPTHSLSQQLPQPIPPASPPPPPLSTNASFGPNYSTSHPPPPAPPQLLTPPAGQLSSKVGDTSLFFARAKSPGPPSVNTSPNLSIAPTISHSNHSQIFAPSVSPGTPKPLADLHSVGKLQIHSHTGPTQQTAPVTDVRRVAHFTFDPERNEYTDVPPEWRDHLQKKFGIPLQLCATMPVDGYPGRIPPVLCFMKSFLVENGGLNQVGIFRLAPDGGLTAQLKQDLNNNCFRSCEDVNVMAHLIKVFLREMPVMLLDYIKDKQIIMNCPETPEAVGSLILEQYQEPQLSLWYWVLDLCCDVADLSEINKMGIPNMSIVIAPNVYKPPNATTDGAFALRMCKKYTTFIEKAIQWRMNTIPKSQRPRGY